MNKIVILSVGKTDSSGIESLVSEYYKRTSRYVAVEELMVPDIKRRKVLSEEEQKKQEGALILSKIQPGDWLVLLDERGKERSSSEMAMWLNQHFNSTAKRLVFVVGGPYGFSSEVYAAANEKVSLSQLTLTHQMVRLFLAEQIYRWVSIIKGLPYHHE